MSDNLKPCPFCGSEDISISKTYVNGNHSEPDFVSIGCSDCGISFKEQTEEEATEYWNTRRI